MSDATRQTRILRQFEDTASEETDPVVVEAPLEIVLQYRKQTSGTWVDLPLTVTMRTPGRDEALITGLLFTEGIINSPDGIIAISESETDGPKVVTLKSPPATDFRDRQRTFLSASSCGFCGKTQLGDLLPRQPPVFDATTPTFSADFIRSLPERLRNAQGQFDATGGTHAAARFSTEGACLGLEEDIGRHNAVDKLIGHALLQATEQKRIADFSTQLLLLSGRVSFELMQKALAAGFPIIVAIGAPSSLAVEMANAARQTLIGFLRADRFNLYSHPQRIRASSRLGDF